MYKGNIFHINKLIQQDNASLLMTNQIKNLLSSIFVLLLTFSAFTQAGNITDKISAKNAKQYTQQFIVGGQPTEHDLVLLSKSGIKTVINLRGNGEFKDFNEKAKVEALGMNYIAIPIAGASGINKKNLKLFTKAITSPEKAFVHCASGNRVGAMFALDAHFNHSASTEEAIAIGKDSGLTRLETKVRKIMAKQ